MLYLDNIIKKILILKNCVNQDYILLILTCDVTINQYQDGVLLLTNVVKNMHIIVINIYKSI